MYIMCIFLSSSSSRPNDLQFNVRCNSEFPHILWCPRTLTTCNTSLAVTCGKYIRDNKMTNCHCLHNIGPMKITMYCVHYSVPWCDITWALHVGQNISTYYPGQIRLVGGQYPSEGRVEVYDSENWVTVSYNSYRANENAHSVCRQLGYTGSIAVSSGTL